MAKVINQGSGTASVIKQSIQGDAGVANAVAFVDVVIDVNENKTVVEWIGNGDTASDGDKALGMGEITSPTNFRITRGETVDAETWNYRLIEFTNLKALHKDTVVLTGGVALNIVIPEVDIDKCQIYLTYLGVNDYGNPTTMAEINVFRRLTTTTNFQLLSRVSGCQVSYFIAESL